MNLSDIYTAIANTLSGVISSRAYPPPSISTADLPMAVLFLDKFYARPRGIGGNILYTLTFRVELLISPVAQSTPESAMAIGDSKLVDVVVALASNPTLGGKVDHLEEAGGDGVHVLSVGLTDYYSQSIRATYIIKE